VFDDAMAVWPRGLKRNKQQIQW